jgi:DNA adenine methylase
LIPYVADLLAANALKPELFVEPFAGGASVALQLLADGVVDSIGLVDRDPLLAGFWRTVFWDSEWLVEQIRTVPLDLDTWRKYKAASPDTDRDRAVTCLYLNRTSFSGILAPRAGPLGGTKRFDLERFACRFPRKTLARRVREAAALAEGVRFVWQLDWHQAIGRIRWQRREGRLPENVFLYCDPPFFSKAERLYPFHFSTADHRRLSKGLLSMEQDSEPWLLSYDSLADVQSLYGESGRNIVTIDRFYTASRLVSRHPIFAEALVTNLPLLPEARRLIYR